MRILIYPAYLLLIAATVVINAIGYRRFGERWSFWLGCGLPAIVMIATLTLFSEPKAEFTDFRTSYYPAGRAIVENPAAIYEPVVESEWRWGFVNPPILALLFVPVSFMSTTMAEITFTLSGLIALGLACLLLIRITEATGWRLVAIVGLFVVNGPLYYSLRTGQLTHFVLFFLVAAVYCLRSGKEAYGGVMLALASFIKPSLLLLGLYFLLRRRWRVFIALTLTIAGTGLASLGLFGLDLHLKWYQESIVPLLGKTVGGFNVQSIDGLLTRFFHEDTLFSWRLIESSSTLSIARWVGRFLIVIPAFWICFLRKPPATQEQWNLEFGIFLSLALIVSTITWTYYYVFLLVPMALYLAGRLSIPEGPLWRYGMIAGFLLVSLPALSIDPNRFLFGPKAYAYIMSHYLYGAVVLLVMMLVARAAPATTAGGAPAYRSDGREVRV